MANKWTQGAIKKRLPGFGTRFIINDRVILADDYQTNQMLEDLFSGVVQAFGKIIKCQLEDKDVNC